MIHQRHRRQVVHQIELTRRRDVCHRTIVPHRPRHPDRSPSARPMIPWQTGAMAFDLPGLLAERQGQGYELSARYLNPQLARLLHAIGFDKEYVRAEGSYLWDRDGRS